MTTKQKAKTPAVLYHAVRDAYLHFDQEDYCEDGVTRCGECWGCAEYRVLEKAWKSLPPKYRE